VLEGAGRATALARVGPDLVLIATASGQVFARQDGVRGLLTVSAGLGAPVSVACVRGSPYFAIGSSEGHVLLYDMRMQCPVRRIRPSNRPAFVCAGDARTLWVTCGPYCARWDVPAGGIAHCFCAPPAHAVRCCCVADWLITAHSDHAVFASRGTAVVDMDDPLARPAVTERAGVVTANRRRCAGQHGRAIAVLKSSGAAPVSCDANGVVVVWPTPVSK